MPYAVVSFSGLVCVLFVAEYIPGKRGKPAFPPPEIPDGRETEDIFKLLVDAALGDVELAKEGELPLAQASLHPVSPTRQAHFFSSQQSSMPGWNLPSGHARVLAVIWVIVQLT